MLTEPSGSFTVILEVIAGTIDFCATDAGARLYLFFVWKRSAGLRVSKHNSTGGSRQTEHD